MIDCKFFESLLSERLNKLYEIIGYKNTNIEHIQNTHHKNEADILVAKSQENLEVNIVNFYQDEIRDIRNSLQKIKDGVFGICEMCDDEIDVERLKAKPHAKYCINCRELFEKTQKKERT